MILIVDSGSTKTDWCLVDGTGILSRFKTDGYNPCYSGGRKLLEILGPGLPVGFDTDCVEYVAFYGAGVYEDKYEKVRSAIQPAFPGARIDVAMDLMASARALLGRRPGFAAILGTGTNSCIYDGREITHNIDSLGFLLGDEGSGAYMGKRLISDYIREYMPADVRDSFFRAYGLTGGELIDRIYSNPMPNAYCAKFTMFLTAGDMAGNEYLEQHVIRGSFRDFFRNIVTRYPAYDTYSFNCVGTIGRVFAKQLTEVAAEFGMDTCNIESDPMQGLVRYHLDGYVF